MNRLLTIICPILLLVYLPSCEQKKNQAAGESIVGKTLSKPLTIKPILVDYKTDTYHISLGESYKISDKVIDWFWAPLGDPDNKIDSTGIDAFRYFEELITYNNDEILPTLDIETNRNLITSFNCSVLFHLEEGPNAEDKFLDMMSRDLKGLKIDSLKKSIRSKGAFVRSTSDYTETYSLKRGRELDYDRFHYTIELNQKNGR